MHTRRDQTRHTLNKPHRQEGITVVKRDMGNEYLCVWPILVVVCYVVFLADGISNLSYAQENNANPDIQSPVVSDPVMPVEMDQDLSERPEIPSESDAPRAPIVEVPLQIPPLPEGVPILPAEEYPDVSAILPQERVARPTAIPPEFSTPNPNFDGIRLGDPGAGVIPPDPNGDVGTNHYVQTVNSSIAFFDKQGNTLAGPMPINTLFAPLGGPCATANVIDPIVNYDPLADRWVVMGFPFASPICVAVSRTNNPVTGGWFVYAFDLTKDSIPDYPKLGVWPDAYYLSLNTPSEEYQVVALDRASMLQGRPARFVGFRFARKFLLPPDLDGPPPASGAPAPFVRHVDGIFGGEDRLEVYEFAVNFQDPSSSTFSFAALLPTDPFSGRLCGSTGFGNCAEQPNGDLLETLPFFTMWRLQYRNFGTHETLVTNHTINVDEFSDRHAGIRWYELRRNDGEPWAIFQQGTFAPQDPAATSFLYRWMGSIAMDKDGNMALGFSASSRDHVPSVRYVGRRVTDPLGLMPQGGSPDGDFTIFPGEGSQTSSDRWGDYSSMSVDPTDSCTFWYTNEYVSAVGGWQTRIAAFLFPNCRTEVELINASLNLDNLDTSLNPDDSRAPAGVFTIEATFTNTSSNSFSNVFLQVDTLTGGNTLLNADLGHSGVGSALKPTIPGGVLQPGETFTAVFEMGLQTMRIFSFFVDTYGEPQD